MRNRLETLDEAVRRVKRSHTDAHPAVKVNPEAEMRNKIVEFVGAKALHRAKRSELKEYMASLDKDETVGRVPHEGWLRKNSHLIKSVKVGNERYCKLTRAGRNTYNYLLTERELAEEEKQEQNQQ